MYAWACVGLQQCMCVLPHTQLCARTRVRVHASVSLPTLRANVCPTCIYVYKTTKIHKPPIIHKLPQTNHSTKPPSPPPSREGKTYKGNLHNEHIELTRVTWTMNILSGPMRYWSWRSASMKGILSISPTVPPSSMTHTSASCPSSSGFVPVRVGHTCV